MLHKFFTQADIYLPIVVWHIYRYQNEKHLNCFVRGKKKKEIFFGVKKNSYHVVTVIHFLASNSRA